MSYYNRTRIYQTEKQGQDTALLFTDAVCQPAPARADQAKRWVVVKLQPSGAVSSYLCWDGCFRSDYDPRESIPELPHPDAFDVRREDLMRGLRMWTLMSAGMDHAATLWDLAAEAQTKAENLRGEAGRIQEAIDKGEHFEELDELWDDVEEARYGAMDSYLVNLLYQRKRRIEETIGDFRRVLAYAEERIDQLETKAEGLRAEAYALPTVQEPTTKNYKGDLLILAGEVSGQAEQLKTKATHCREYIKRWQAVLDEEREEFSDGS